jgi:hypothetical protein
MQRGEILEVYQNYFSQKSNDIYLMILGPLSIVVGDHSNQFLQVGIVSYGHDIGNQTAAFYTDVRSMIFFIL